VLDTHLAAWDLAGEFQPAIACWKPAGTGAAEWAIGWVSFERTPSALFVDRLTGDFSTTLEDDLAVTPGGFEERFPSLAARAGASARAEFGMVWQRNLGDWDVRAQRFGDNRPPAPVADFSAAPTSGQSPLQVTFTDLSTGSPTSWAWDFQNDGTVDSMQQNPTFTYSPGTYTVKLTVTNAGGSDDNVKVGLISVRPGPINPPQGGGAPVADFTASPLSGPAPLVVQFTDRSTGSITNWSWHFGDNSTDTARNPAHTFTTPGTYTVFLTVSGPAGANTKIAPNLITVTAPGGSTSSGSSGSGSTNPFKKRSGGGGGGGCAAGTHGAHDAAAVLPLAALVAIIGTARRRRGGAA
jgi:PKD repeat protein